MINATSTIDQILVSGTVSTTTGEVVYNYTYEIPAVDFFVVWSVMIFTLFLCWFVYDVIKHKRK